MVTDRKQQRRVSPKLAAYKIPSTFVGATARTDIGYIRWSNEKDPTKSNLTEPSQVAAVDQMHTGFSDGRPLRLLKDEARSGRAGKVHLRSSYQEMVELVEADQVHTIYVAFLTRLGRSLLEGIRLIDLCKQHGVRVITGDFGIIDTRHANGALIFNVLMSAAQWEGDMAVERSRAAMAERIRKGDPVGQLNYGLMVDRTDKDNPKVVPHPTESVHLRRILELYAQHRVLGATVRALNAEGVPTRRGGLWTPASLRLLLAREAPDLLPAKVEHRVKPAAPFVLFRLLRCHCGAIMTGTRDSRPGKPARYKCRDRDLLAGHGKGSVSELALLPWVQVQADRAIEAQLAAVGGDRVQAAEDYAAERSQLLAQKKRVTQSFIDGDIERADKVAQHLELDAQIERLTLASQSTTLPSQIVWPGREEEGKEPWSAVHINVVLRTLWSEIQLDREMRPVRVVPAGG